MQPHPNFHHPRSPILRNSNACINCRTGAMNISFRNKKVKLNIFSVTQGPSNDEERFAIDLIDLIQESMEEISPLLLTMDLLQSCLIHFNIDEFECEVTHVK